MHIDSWILNLRIILFELCYVDSDTGASQAQPQNPSELQGFRQLPSFNLLITRKQGFLQHLRPEDA